MADESRSTSGYASAELVTHAIDSMGQFLREAARLPLLTGPRSSSWPSASSAATWGQGTAHQPQPAPRRLDRQALSGDDVHDPAGPGPGGDDRVDPRHGEVRLAQGLSVLDLRDAVDPPIDPARPGHPGADIRLPAHVVQHERRIARVHRELAARLGHDPTDEEIATAAGLPVEQVAEIKQATRVVTSLDRPWESSRQRRSAS